MARRQPESLIQTASDILLVEAAVSFGLGPLPILLRTRLFRFGHRYAFRKYGVSACLCQERGGLRKEAVALSEEFTRPGFVHFRLFVPQQGDQGQGFVRQQIWLYQR